MKTAVTRTPAHSLASCELTFVERKAINIDVAIAQHQQYRAVLASLGLNVINLPAMDAFPDSCFVEDDAVVLGDVAVLLNPGAESRREEVGLIADALADLVETVSLKGSGTIDGGDVLTVGKTCFVGISTRTSREGFESFQKTATGLGFDAIPIDTKHSLHLKTAVTSVDDETLLFNPEWLDIVDFAGFRLLEAKEQFGANVLRVGDQILVDVAHKLTNEELTANGFDLVTTDISEFKKAEAGLTCLSLLI